MSTPSGTAEAAAASVKTPKEQPMPEEHEALASILEALVGDTERTPGKRLSKWIKCEK